MRTTSLAAALILLAAKAGAEPTTCINLYPHTAGQLACGLFPQLGAPLEPFGLKTTDAGGTTGLTVWTIDGSTPSPFLAKYKGTPFAAGGYLYIPGVFILLTGERENSAVQWTAPSAGTFTFTGYFEELTQEPVGMQASIVYNQTDITASSFANGTGYLSGPGANLTKLKPGGKETFSFQLTVSQGDVVIFVDNINYPERADDVVGFKLDVVASP